MGAGRTSWKARDYSIIAPRRNGALTGRLAYEGQQRGRRPEALIVILNDNGMSIA